VAIVDGLITLAEARASLGWATGQTADDADLEKYIEAATPVIENITGPVLVKTRIYTVDGGRPAVVLPVRFTSVTSITVDGGAYTNFTTDASAGVVMAGSTTAPDVFGYGIQNVVVTVSVGTATVPANIKLATRELVRFWWQQGRQANIPAFGEAPPDNSVPMGFAVPKRVIELLQSSPRVAGFA